MLWLGVHFPLLPLEVFAACGRGDGTRTRRSGLQTANSAEIRDREIAPTKNRVRDREIAPTKKGVRERATCDLTASDTPTVVIDERGRVMLRNAAATGAGIIPGSTLATAHSIVTGLEHYRRSPQREQQRLELLAEALYGFSARVSLAPPAAAGNPPIGIALEIGGSLKLFGDAAELARQAAALCRGMGHEVCVRWASTPLAALILACSDAASLSRVPLRQAAVEPQRLTADHIERFANMGIHTLGQLLALPSRGLAERFGEGLVDYLTRLTGDRPDPRPVIRPAEHFHVTLHLLEPLNSKEALAFPMQRLLTDLQHWLVARQLGAEQLRWHFTGSGSDSHRGNDGPCNRICMPLRFARAQQSRDAFLDITRLQLAEATLPEDVISLALEARRLTPWSAASHSASHSASRNLFGNLPGLQSVEDTDDLSGLVDQLRARLGQDACYILEVEDQHTPERAWKRALPLRHARPPTRKQANKPAGKRPGKQKTKPQENAPRLLKRPLWLFDPPRPVDRRQLALLRGPERIHTGWWLDDGDELHDPPGQARDYYVARHHSGARCWVFTDPWQRWFLHGYFS